MMLEDTYKIVSYQIVISCKKQNKILANGDVMYVETKKPIKKDLTLHFFLVYRCPEVCLILHNCWWEIACERSGMRHES